MSYPDKTPHQPFVDATQRLDQPEALQRFAREQGYLFFQGLVGTERPESIRRSAQAHLADCGLVVPDSDPVEARPRAKLSGMGFDDERWIRLQSVVYQNRDFQLLGEDPRILQVMAAVFGEEAQPHVGDICRVGMPGALKQTTPPHQDRVFYGRDIELWTVWLPIVECPLELGPLAVVPATHRAGALPHTVPGSGAVELPRDVEWASSPLQPGDALMFHGLTIHGAWHNTTQRRVRLSVDYRYQPVSQPLGPAPEDAAAGF